MTALTIDEIRADVAEIVAKDPSAIDPGQNLIVLGLGSIEIMRLATRWRRGGHAVDVGRLAADPTIDAWHGLLAGERGETP
ncbi:hypothetical protein GCM10028784_20310 [Myceligenerans cantabricum]